MEKKDSMLEKGILDVPSWWKRPTENLPDPKKVDAYLKKLKDKKGVDRLNG